MKIKINILLLGFALLAACDKREPVTVGNAEKVEFGITTKSTAGNTVPNLSTQEVRLYLGEHKTEHWDNKKHLHLREKYTLTGSSFLLENMPEQRYKFAFVCVPKLDGMFSEKVPGTNSCDFNAHLIDFTPVLNAQAQASQASQALVNTGHIYRKVINRWLRSGEALTENVTLNRLNGQLIIDMGVPEDQFEHEVARIDIHIDHTPTEIYIRDNDNDEIILVEDRAKSFVYTSVPQWNVNKRHIITLNLLPSELQGDIFVYRKGDDKPQTFPFKGMYNRGKVHIKRNTRTTLEFNGLHKDYFTVKYAGFDGSQIGVDDDQWDGWQK